MALGFRKGSLRCKERDEQDLGVALDRAPDRSLHVVAGHAEKPVT